MQISTHMAVNLGGMLIYIGSNGTVYQIVGGINGNINLVKLS
jgi:hypothetical protein